MTLLPGLDDAFLDVVRAHTAGDPMRQDVLWTNLSRRQIAAKLAERGFRVSVTVVKQLLARHRLGCRKAKKSKTMGASVHRDRQFQIIARRRAEYEQSPNPIVSIDSKKKELIGEFFREGRLYAQQPLTAFDHDYPGFASGVVYPHGLYDVQANCGHLNLGLSHDTSRFACDSIAFWWETYGRVAYPQATSLLLLCDGGGSNGSRRYIFKYHLERLADWLNLEIRVCHYPPYCSKYNPIEHRFFPHVTRACQGLLFTSLPLLSEAMARTETRTGLKTTVNIFPGDYPTGETAPKDYKKTMRILCDDELPTWNYRAVPTKMK